MKQYNYRFQAFILSICFAVAAGEFGNPVNPPSFNFDQGKGLDPVVDAQNNVAAAASSPSAHYYATNPEGAYNVQTNYDGFVVPKDTSDLEHSLETLGLAGLGAGIATYGSKMLHKFPKIFLRILTKVAIWTTAIFSVVVVGTVFTTALCTFTPLCAIKFNDMGWNQNQFEETVRSFITPQRVSALSKFVNEAIEKYKNVQRSTKSGQ